MDVDKMKSHVACCICLKKFKAITNTHLREHGTTLSEYITKYGNSSTGIRGRTHETQNKLGVINQITKFAEDSSVSIIIPYTNSRSMMDIYCETHNVSTQMSGDMASKRVKKKVSLCNVCAKLEVFNNAIQLSDDQYVSLANVYHNNAYEYDLPLKVDACGKIKVKYPHHGIFEIRRSAHVSPTQLYGCQKCQQSKGEIQISSVLNAMKVEYETEKTFPMLVSTKNGVTPFRYDFFVPAYNLLIEFDGIHHYMPTPYGNRDPVKYHQDVLARDAIKTQFAIENNINLLRIPYFERDISKIIKEEIQKWKNG